LLAYLDACEATDTDDAGGQHVALRLETRLVRGKDTAAVEFRYTDDPHHAGIKKLPAAFINTDPARIIAS